MARIHRPDTWRSGGSYLWPCVAASIWLEQQCNIDADSRLLCPRTVCAGLPVGHSGNRKAETIVVVCIVCAAAVSGSVPGARNRVSTGMVHLHCACVPDLHDHGAGGRLRGMGSLEANPI